MGWTRLKEGAGNAYREFVTAPSTLVGLTLSAMVTGEVAVGAFLRGDVAAGFELTGITAALGGLVLDGGLRHDYGHGLFQSPPEQPPLSHLDQPT